MNKNLLIILGVVLLIVIGGLGIYAYNLSRLDIPEIGSIEKNNFVKEGTSTLNDTSDEDLNSIQESFSKKSEEVYFPEDGQLSETDMEEINENPIKSAKGLIKDKNSDSILVGFEYQGSVWESTVEISQDTRIYLPAPNANTMGEEVDLSELTVGEEVIVNGENEIVNLANFSALSIHKMN